MVDETLAYIKERVAPEAQLPDGSDFPFDAGTTVLAMSDEMVTGKRTMIARAGHEDFELPPDTRSVRRDERGHVVSAVLRSGDHRSVFFASMEERERDVLLRLGTLVGSTGSGVSGSQALPQVLPYPFPDD